MYLSADLIGRLYAFNSDRINLVDKTHNDRMYFIKVKKSKNTKFLLVVSCVQFLILKTKLPVISVVDHSSA